MIMSKEEVYQFGKMKLDWQQFKEMILDKYRARLELNQLTNTNDLGSDLTIPSLTVEHQAVSTGKSNKHYF